MVGAISNCHPGRLPPDTSRTASATPCAAASSGHTCSACSNTENHSKRRWIVTARKLSSV